MSESVTCGWCLGEEVLAILLPEKSWGRDMITTSQYNSDMLCTLKLLWL